MISLKRSTLRAPFSIWPLMKKVGVEIDAEGLARLRHGGDLFEQLLVLEALFEFSRGHSSHAHHRFERPRAVGDARPTVLGPIEQIDGGIPFVVADAASEHEAGRCARVEGEFAHDEPNLAGIDILLLELRPDLHVERAAMGTGQRSIFDDGDRRILLPEALIRKGSRREQGLRRGLR